MFAHHIALEGIVIKEHHRVKSYVKNIPNGANVICLVLPVSNKNCNVIKFEDHLRVFLERFFGFTLIILATYCNDNTPVLKLLYPFLKFSEGFADTQSVPYLNILPSVITDYATPYRIIEIKNKAFLKSPFDSTYNIESTCSHIRQSINTQNHFGTHIYHAVEHKITAKFILQTCNITNEKIGIFLGQIHQFKVELTHLVSK